MLARRRPADPRAHRPPPRRVRDRRAIFLAVNYLGRRHRGALRRRHGLRVPIEYLREDEPLGTAGALGLLPEPPTRTAPPAERRPRHLGGPRRPARRATSPAAIAATIGTRRYLHTVPFGCVERDGDRVTGLEEKPTLAREVNTGIYALDPSVVGPCRRGRRVDTARPHRRPARRGEPVGAFEIEDDWIDVGQREQLAAARGRSPRDPARHHGPRHRRRRLHRQPPRRAAGRATAPTCARSASTTRAAPRAGSTRRDRRRARRPRHPSRRHPRRALRGAPRPRASRSSSTSRR